MITKQMRWFMAGSALFFAFGAGVLSRDIAQDHRDEARICIDTEVAAELVMPATLPPGCEVNERNGGIVCTNEDTGARWLTWRPSLETQSIQRLMKKGGQ